MNFSSFVLQYENISLPEAGRIFRGNRMKRSTILILILLMMAGFAAIVWSADLVSAQFGKAGETAALCVIAAVLLAGYIKSKGDK